MFDNIVSFITGVEVKELENKVVRVLGLKTFEFIHQIDRFWKTSKITSFLFKKVASRQLDIHPFFVPDFYYICKKLMGERRARINRTAVQQVIDGLMTNSWIKSVYADNIPNRLDFSALNRFLVAPLKQQIDFLRIYNENVTKWQLLGYILGAAPGSGKTYMGYALSECLNTDITICIVPKNSVLDVWVATPKWMFREQPKLWNSLGGEPLTKGYRYYIFHYEQIDRALEFFKKGYEDKKINIVLDESHNLNELSSQRTQLIIDLVKAVKCQDTLWSSGTPIKAMGSEVIPILRCIDPFFDEEAESRFRKIYGLSSSRALDILAHRLGFMTFLVDKAVAVGNKVEYFRVDVSIKNGNDYTLTTLKLEMRKFIAERVEYYKANMDKYVDHFKQGLRFYERTLKTRDQIRDFEEYVRVVDLLHFHFDPFIHKTEPIFCNAYEKKYILPALPKELRDSFKNARSVYKYVNLKVQGEALGRVLGRKRMQCNVDMLDGANHYRVTDLQTGEKYETSLFDIVENSIKKTVIFTSYVEVVDRVYADFKKAGAHPVRVYGDTNNDLSAILKTFTNEPKIDPLIATLQSLSTAVPLIMANTEVFLNSPFRIHEKVQAVARVDRLGQTETVQIFDVFLDTGEDPNISTRSSDIMEWSKEMVDTMLGLKGASVAALEELREDLAANNWDVPEDVIEAVEGLSEELKGVYSW